jgi:hypothetical protein
MIRRDLLQVVLYTTFRNRGGNGNINLRLGIATSYKAESTMLEVDVMFLNKMEQPLQTIFYTY